MGVYSLPTSAFDMEHEQGIEIGFRTRELLGVEQKPSFH